MNVVLGSRQREVRAGSWLLEWRTPTGRISENFKLDWVRIVVVRPKRGEEDNYIDQEAERVSARVRRGLQDRRARVRKVTWREIPLIDAH